MQRFARQLDHRNTRHSARCRLAHRGRFGFTLVELLIVVSIIAVLMTLTVRVVGAFIGQARDSATQATIRKVEGLLRQRAQALDRMLQRPSFIENSAEYGYPRVLQLSNGDVNLRKILAIKEITRKYFPQLQSEVNANLQPKIASAASASSAEILYDFLTQSNVLGTATPGVDAFSTSEVKDTDGDGLPEFVDAWGNPLRFYRWPTRLFRPTGYPTVAAPTTGIDATNAKVLLSTLPSFSGNLLVDLARDPDDPLRRLVSATTFTNFENPGVGVLYHTPATYHVMLVVSAGADGVLGLYEPEDTSSTAGYLGAAKPNAAYPSLPPDELTDDITYLNIRAGGR